MKSKEMIDAIMADPCSSYWLRVALGSSLELDPVDRLHDAEALIHIFRVAADEALREQSAKAAWSLAGFGSADDYRKAGGQ